MRGWNNLDEASISFLGLTAFLIPVVLILPGGIPSLIGFDERTESLRDLGRAKVLGDVLKS